MESRSSRQFCSAWTREAAPPRSETRSRITVDRDHLYGWETAAFLRRGSAKHPAAAGAPPLHPDRMETWPSTTHDCGPMGAGAEPLRWRGAFECPGVGTLQSPHRNDRSGPTITRDEASNEIAAVARVRAEQNRFHWRTVRTSAAGAAVDLPPCKAGILGNFPLKLLKSGILNKRLRRGFSRFSSRDLTRRFGSSPSSRRPRARAPCTRAGSRPSQRRRKRAPCVRPDRA